MSKLVPHCDDPKSHSKWAVDMVEIIGRDKTKGFVYVYDLDADLGLRQTREAHQTADAIYGSEYAFFERLMSDWATGQAEVRQRSESDARVDVHRQQMAMCPHV